MINIVQINYFLDKKYINDIKGNFDKIKIIVTFHNLGENIISPICNINKNKFRTLSLEDFILFLFITKTEIRNGKINLIDKNISNMTEYELLRNFYISVNDNFKNLVTYDMAVNYNSKITMEEINYKNIDLNYKNIKTNYLSEYIFLNLIYNKNYKPRFSECLFTSNNASKYSVNLYMKKYKLEMYYKEVSDNERLIARRFFNKNNKTNRIKEKNSDKVTYFNNQVITNPKEFNFPLASGKIVLKFTKKYDIKNLDNCNFDNIQIDYIEGDNEFIIDENFPLSKFKLRSYNFSIKKCIIKNKIINNVYKLEKCNLIDCSLINVFNVYKCKGIVNNYKIDNKYDDNIIYIDSTDSEQNNIKIQNFNIEINKIMTLYSRGMFVDIDNLNLNTLDNFQISGKDANLFSNKITKRYKCNININNIFSINSCNLIIDSKGSIGKIQINNWHNIKSCYTKKGNKYINIKLPKN